MPSKFFFALAGAAGLVLFAAAGPSHAYSGGGIVRDHRPVVRDHRDPGTAVVRDHRGPVVRDHRGESGNAGGVTVTSGKPRGNTTCGRLVFGGPTVCVSY